MPHRVKMGLVSIGPLRDIREEDCLKEGIVIDTHRGVLDDNIYMFDFEGKHYCQWHFPNPREAFAVLINRPGVGRPKMWEDNPMVFAYELDR